MLTRPRILALLPSLLVASLIVVLFGLRPLDILDRLFVPDDTYYTLTIARSLAMGEGPVASHGTLTSGFQPLIAFLMVPVFWLGAEADQALRAVLLLSSSIGVLVTGMMVLFLLRRTGSVSVAAMGGLFTATSPNLITNHFNGLETSLAGFLTLLAVLLAYEIPRGRPARIALATGFVVGLAILARIDTIFVVVLIGLWILARHGAAVTAIVAGTAFVIVAPWWTYCLVEFGSVVPESGGAVRQLVHYHQEAGHQTSFGQVAMAVIALGTLGYGASASGLVGSFTGIVFAKFAAIYSALRNWRSGPEALLALASLTLLAFYVCYLPALWFFERYLYPVFLSAIVCGAVGIWKIASRGGDAGIAMSGLIGAGLVATNLFVLLPYLSSPDGRLERRIDGPKGYREVAIAVLQQLPDAAVVGSMQTGALAFYADRDIRVVNLDGVVNGEAKDAMGRGELGDYLLRRSVAYFADWERGLSKLRYFAADGDASLDFRPISTFPMSLDDPFILYDVDERSEMRSLPHGA
ncbi:hypothetical protein DEA8626_00264 [Defluviimonas aquaemixtae]|uniref:Glycosyltransferase RgtA/B/C/D-like domain-containing protein n=1 Tax=Albidovulum aquaemixtae TaxID=1542388 RepID=A0A2R8B2H6_9RHOB|nr:hypothetical protein [Defluviimonas aquaemixtae]SPH16753.1 hypothetical protein DEA8626_00264 [Defluviimonas aquaemixtae]